MLGPEHVLETAPYANISATGLVDSGPGRLLGIFVASSTSGTIKVWDNTAGSGNIIVNTFNAVGGTFYPIPASYKTGVFVTIGGTLDCTVFRRPD